MASPLIRIVLVGILSAHLLDVVAPLPSLGAAQLNDGWIGKRWIAGLEPLPDESRNQVRREVRMRFRPVPLIVALALAACVEAPTSAPSDIPTLAISDGTHGGGNAHFYFLPPMVSAQYYTGAFDGSLAPVVRITEAGAALVDLTPGANVADETYHVNWHTRDFNLDPARPYRISVLVGSYELGYADVDVVATGRELRNVNSNDFVPLLNGRTLPIKFRIEQGAITQPSYSLDFRDAWATVSDHADLDLSTTWTLEAWIKPRSVALSEFQHVVSKWDGGGNASYTLEVHAGHLRSAIHDGVNPTQAVESFGTLANDQWQHVAITLENGTLSLYINGLLDRTYTGSQTPMISDRPLSFGREGPPYGGWRYDGLIDEVRVWNVARTGAQLLGAMNLRLVGSEAGLAGYWRFDEGTGDVAFDATGRGLNAQLGNLVGPDANDPIWSTDRAPIP